MNRYFFFAYYKRGAGYLQGVVHEDSVWEAWQKVERKNKGLFSVLAIYEQAEDFFENKSPACSRTPE